MLTEGFEPIPGYRLQNFLGRGQFGEVWRSSSPGGTHVALKFLNLRERQGRKEFRAIQKVKGIRYPHLVLTYALWLLDENMQVIGDAAFDSDQPLLIDTLGATLMRQPTLNSPRHELGDGPVAIHHCDIKPENIMILGDLAVVGDFGVARILSSGADSRATTMGGSVAYYELRTGKLPFPEESKAQVIRDKLAGHLKFGDVSSQEAEVLQRATSVQPGKRFPSARAFVKALRKAESITVRKPNVLWSFMGIVLTAFATLIAITSIAWYMKLDPFAAMIKTAPLPVAITRNENPEFFQSEKVASIDVVPANTEMAEKIQAETVRQF